jgi:hypothetical protein
MMTKVWIVGAGRFGQRAAGILARRWKPQDILVLDRLSEALAAVDSPGIQKMDIDGLEFMIRHLNHDSRPDWIIPCVPFHLARGWIMARLGDRAETIPVPDDFLEKVPNPMRADEGGVFVSYADFFCPPDCPEPADICTYTGLPRKGNLFKDLEDQAWPGYTMLVLRSRQLAPGLGGIRTEELFELETRLSNIKGRILLATSCRCHGVIHALNNL